LSEALRGGGVVALVPMGRHSERVPGKNWRVCHDRPLCAHILGTLSRCATIDRVVVDTDSPEVAGIVRERFPHVRVIDRVSHLRGGHVPMTEVIRHDVRECAAWLGEGGVIVQTHATNPLLRAETIDAAVRVFLVARRRGYDSVFGVTRWQTRLYDADARAMNHDPRVLMRTQDLAPVYEENSNVYVFGPGLIEREGVRIGRRPVMLEIDRIEAIDIDDEAGFLLAEAALARGLGERGAAARAVAQVLGTGVRGVRGEEAA
jgi:CMP-N-acetylneuraminic acid synthetase